LPLHSNGPPQIPSHAPTLEPQDWSKMNIIYRDGVRAEAYHLVLGDAIFTSPPITANRFGVAPKY
jgi:hypothetical protein